MNFLLANISIDIDFEILFFTLSNVEIYFNHQEFKSKLHTIAKALFIFKQVQFVRKKEFAIASLDLKDDIFIV